jgi:hypothetical protein
MTVFANAIDGRLFIICFIFISFGEPVEFIFFLGVCPVRISRMRYEVDGVGMPR